jgi:hypothetical protein
MGYLVPPVFIGGAPANQSIAVTSSATANAFGAWASFGTLPCAVDEIYIYMEANYNSLVNIGVGASGSQEIIIPQIAQQTDTTTYGYSPGFFRYRRKLPAGTEVWAQCSCSSASNSGRFSLGVGFSGSPGFSTITPLGVDLASSFLVAQTSGATAGTYGAWVSLGTLAIPGKNLWYVSTRDPGSLTTLNIGVGASGSQAILLKDIPVLFANLPFELEMDCPPGEYWMQVAGGSSVTTNGGIWIAS